MDSTATTTGPCSANKPPAPPPYPDGRWHAGAGKRLPQAVPADALAESRRILASAVQILGQGEELLGTVEAGAYAKRLPVAFNASIGGHYRHCLDHFTSLLASIDTAELDYDHRRRDPRIESDPIEAMALTRILRQRLESICPSTLGCSLTVNCEISYAHGESSTTSSSLGRELVYSIAHAIHHYALISVMARLMEIPLPPNFGVAPSTLSAARAAAMQD